MSERATSTVRAGSLPAVGVFRFETSFRLLTTSAAPAGAVLLRLEGVVNRYPSRHAIQIGIEQHLDIPPETDLTEVLDRYGWQFLNHSCVPNARIRSRELVALRALEAWEEITFDYHTTEFDMASPFRCHCGARDCVGTVRGYAHLSPEARRRIEATAAPHVLALSRRTGDSTS